MTFREPKYTFMMNAGLLLTARGLGRSDLGMVGKCSSRGTGTTVLTYHLGFGFRLTTRELGCLFWPLILTKTRLMAEDLAGPPVMGLTYGCVSAPFQNIWNTVVVVCVTSASNKWLIRVNLMVTRTTTTTIPNRQSDTSQGYLAPCSGCS